ncbi:MAG: hypothetical protein RBU37_13050 [Myxococcota bacterium]|jgi:hypothetical protein|nr:hypothetical protein [Myxococcota bacterium]
MNPTLSHQPFRRQLAALRDFFSFSSEVRLLVDTLNREIDAPENVSFRLPSHPVGFVREVTKRRLTIAEAYLKLIHLSAPDEYEERLEVLRTLAHQAWHSKTMLMPLNTARVQIALMKACVKAVDDRRRQLELMSDFALSSYGQPHVIRRLLDELDLIEVPELGRPLRELDVAWDDHVHDFLTEGRKTPSQLVLDAFIKGMSRITIAYYDLTDTRIYDEAVRAGEILGISVSIGLEFSVGQRFERQHFMYVPPQDGTVQGLKRFLDEVKSELKPFFDGLRENAHRRRDTVNALLESFNEGPLREFNARFPNQNYLHLEPMSWAQIERVTHGGQASRIHLGQVLWEAIKPVLHKRVLYLKSQHQLAAERLSRGDVSSWEAEQRERAYLDAREEYVRLSPGGLVERYLATRKGVDYDSAFPDCESVLPLLAKSTGRVVFIHPLSQGTQRAIRTLLENASSIHEIETFNMADAARRESAEVRRLNLIVEELNRGRTLRLRRLLVEWGFEGIETSTLRAASRHYAANNLAVRCGSDSVGWNSELPGMGFAAAARLNKQSVRKLKLRRHPSIPRPVAQLLLKQRFGQGSVKATKSAEGEGAFRPAQELALRRRRQAGRVSPPPDASSDDVYVLGTRRHHRINLIGDEDDASQVGLARFWRYLNINLKAVIKIGIGFVPAYLLVGPFYALLWLGLTALRNIVVDQVASSGISLRAWRWKNVDRDNLANSLFWTGFSVPVLTVAKYGFDLTWASFQGPSGFLHELSKFWLIAFANGLYISTHNRLRGFDRSVIRGNFFRTVLSWPLATAGSYLFNPLGVPAIVQSKFWSEVVAALIEGTGKFLKQIRLSQRLVLEVLVQLIEPVRRTRQTARADLLFIWARLQQGKRALDWLLRTNFRRRKRAWLSVEDIERIERARLELVECYTADGSMESLVGLILEHYSGREAMRLTTMIAEYHEPFVRWLSGTKIPPTSSGNAQNTSEIDAFGPQDGTATPTEQSTSRDELPGEIDASRSRSSR